ncbi:hypothetical protein [Sphingomonas xinjiangensis]|uniref:Uncharacterized protein n=1 Tax=Sphingomonas xinjiangensis TaxID=643568 RepID=A0A840YLJ9_9SPHN|nr:hypothetical protein [Sphingomonas xinjiangensis]MBB5710356.1 hypothetical protein [Sphingomonas xinjiangensis]
MRVLRLLPLALALTACGRADEDPSGLSPDEARRLNEAAAAIDINSSTPVNLSEDAQ